MSAEDSLSFARCAGSTLRDQADRLDKCGAPQVGGPWTLLFKDLSAGYDAIARDLKTLISGGDRCVYVFRLTEIEAVASLRYKMAEIVGHKKAKTGDFGASKYVAQYNANAADSCNLYVGSSFATGKRTNTLASRLAQHLGISNETTYAMYLARWAYALPGGVRITVYQYPHHTIREDVLAIEDYLAGTLNPLLGRRGRAR
jgi:hypothetical protein